MWILSSLLASASAVGLEPIRVAVECQSEGTVDVCDYVRGHIGSTEGLLMVERSHADLMLFSNVTVKGNTEDVLLSVTSLGDWQPAKFELLRSTNARQDADDLQALVSELTLEVLSPYLLQAWPGSLQLTLESENLDVAEEELGSPYSFVLRLGTWSFLTSGYKNIDLWGGLSLSSLEEDRSWSIGVNGSGGWLRQPPLVIDGVEYALDSETAEASLEASVVRDLNPSWSIGGWFGAGMQDPEQRFEQTARLHMGIERNWFPSNHPKNNRFAIAYLLGVQADRYHQINIYGDIESLFPKQMLLASGSVRKGRMEYSFGVDMISELFRPLKQYQLSGWTYGSLYLGDHVDLTLWLDLTQQAIPGPAELDQSNYEEITQGSYAEPLAVSGNISLRFHWDRSNGALYNRFYSATRQGPLENL